MKALHWKLAAALAPAAVALLVLSCWIDAPVGRFRSCARSAVHELLAYGLQIGAAVIASWVGWEVARATGRKWIGWAVGLPLFLVLSLGLAWLGFITHGSEFDEPSV